jgi:hypothetical protein
MGQQPMCKQEALSRCGAGQEQTEARRAIHGDKLCGHAEVA